MEKVLPQPGLLNECPPVGRPLKVGLQFGGLLKCDLLTGGLSLGKGISKRDSPIEGLTNWIIVSNLGFLTIKVGFLQKISSFKLSYIFE